MTAIVTSNVQLGEPDLQTTVSKLQVAVRSGNLPIVDTSGTPLAVDPNSFGLGEWKQVSVIFL